MNEALQLGAAVYRVRDKSLQSGVVVSIHRNGRHAIRTDKGEVIKGHGSYAGNWQSTPEAAVARAVKFAALKYQNHRLKDNQAIWTPEELLEEIRTLLGLIKPVT